MMRDVLIRWLLVKGFGEEARGFGHATAEDIADGLLDEWDIRFKEPT